MIQIGDKFEYLKAIEETNERKNRNKVEMISKCSKPINNEGLRILRESA